ncbi:MAG: tetratricopeptide repeat protein [Saprospiraceae bacterium]
MKILRFIIFFTFLLQLLSVDSYGHSPIQDTILNRIERAEQMQNQNKETAFELMKQTLQLAIDKKESYGQLKSYYALGLYHYKENQLDKSIEIYQKYTALAQELDSLTLEGLGIMRLGNCYLKLGRFDVAKSNFEKALAIFKKENEKLFEGDALGNLGNVNMMLSLKEKALANYTEAYDLYGQVGEIEKQQTVQVNISYYHLTNGNGKAALPYLFRFLEYSQKNGEAKNTAICFGNLGYAYSLLGNYPNAFENYQHCIDTAQKYQFVQLECDTYKDISETYRKMGNYKKAIQYQTKYYSLRDSIIDKETQDRVSELQVQFETVEQQQEIEQLQQRQRIRSLQISLLIIGLGLFGTIGWFVFKKQRNNLEEKQAIITKNEEIYRLEKELIEKELQQKQLEQDKITAQANILKQQEAETRKYAEVLENSNKELETFAHVVAHDLREPLRMVTAYMQLIKRNLDKENLAKTAEYFDFALDGSERMNRLIKGILNLATVQQQELKLRSIDLNDIALIVTQNLHETIEEKQATINCSNLPKINGDKLQIIQLFQNIISNGIKYNTNKIPTISISHQIIDNKVEIAFEDNGIGIAEASQRNIFKMFNRLESHRFSGTGIGLATCQKIVERHNGTISVESELSEGTTFIVTLLC